MTALSVSSVATTADLLRSIKQDRSLAVNVLAIGSGGRASDADSRIDASSYPLFDADRCSGNCVELDGSAASTFRVTFVTAETIVIGLSGSIGTSPRPGCDAPGIVDLALHGRDGELFTATTLHCIPVAFDVAIPPSTGSSLSIPSAAMSPGTGYASMVPDSCAESRHPPRPPPSFFEVRNSA